MQIIKAARNRPKPSFHRVSRNVNHLYKVGDRVVYNAVNFGNTDLNGKTGTIIYVDNTGAPYTVQFDDWEDVHNGILDLRAEKHGAHYPTFSQWFCKEENLKKIK